MPDSKELVYDLVILVIRFGVTIFSILFCYILAKKNNMSEWFALLGLFGPIGIVAVVLIAKFSNENYTDYDRKNNQYDFNHKNNYGGHNGYNNSGCYDRQNSNNNSLKNGYNNPGYYNGQDENNNSYNNSCGNPGNYSGQNGNNGSYENGCNNPGNYNGQNGSNDNDCSNPGNCSGQNGNNSYYNPGSNNDHKTNNNMNNYGEHNIVGNTGYYGRQNGDTSRSSNTHIQNREVAARRYGSCPKCGAKIEEKASFCTYCGKQL